MRERAFQTCHVSDGDCIAPAGYGTASGISLGDKACRGKCYFCGLPVCSKCSSITRTHNDKHTRRVRICADCMTERNR